MTAKEPKLDDGPQPALMQPLPPKPRPMSPTHPEDPRPPATPDSAERPGRTEDEHLRRRTGAVAATAALATAVGFLVPLPDSGPLVAGLTNALHTPAFLALTLLTLHGARRCGLRSWRADAVLALALFGCGATLEALQWLSGRSPGLHDLTGNLCGIGAGLLLHWSWLDRSRSDQRRMRARTIASSLLAVSLLIIGVQPGLALILETLLG